MASEGSGLSGALQGERECVFGDTVVKAAIYLGDKLRPGDTLKGPAIIEERITTVVVPPSFSCTVDDYGNGVLTRIAARPGKSGAKTARKKGGKSEAGKV